MSSTIIARGTHFEESFVSITLLETIQKFIGTFTFWNGTTGFKKIMLLWDDVCVFVLEFILFITL
jgi:hypothetical protein